MAEELWIMTSGTIRERFWPSVSLFNKLYWEIEGLMSRYWLIFLYKDEISCDFCDRRMRHFYYLRLRLRLYQFSELQLLSKKFVYQNTRLLYGNLHRYVWSWYDHWSLIKIYKVALCGFADVKCAMALNPFCLIMYSPFNHSRLAFHPWNNYPT